MEQMERLVDSCCVTCVRVVRPLEEIVAWFANVGVEASDNPVIGVSTNDGDSSKRCSLISKSSSSEGGVDDLSSQKSYRWEKVWRREASRGNQLNPVHRGTIGEYGE